MDNNFIKESLLKRYNISDNGNIINKKTGKELTPHKDPKGYNRIRLTCPELTDHKEGRKTFKVHRLVALFYLENYTNDLQVNHKNGIKNDNRIENLEMVTNSENVLHAWRYLNKEERLNKLNKRRNKSNGRFK